MKTRCLALAFATLLPLAAVADDVRYKYLDISYQIGGEVDTGLATSDTTGFALTGSFVITDAWFLRVDYSNLDTDPDIGNIDRQALALGWHNEMFFASLGWQGADAGSVKGSGYELDLGLRGMLSEVFELNGHLGMSDLGDIGTTVSYGIGGVLYFNRNAPDGHRVGLSFNYDLDQVSDFAATPGFEVDASTYGVGLRIDFD